MSRNKIRSLLRRLAKAFGIVLALVALFILEENLRGKCALWSYRRELRARGEKLTLAELGLPRPSAPGSALPEFLATGKELEELQTFPIGGLVGLRFIGYRLPVVRHQQPEIGLNWFITISNGKRRATWSDLAEQLNHATNALARVKAISAQPIPTARIDYSLYPYYFYDSYLQATHSVADWLAVTALSDLHRGDLDAAVENIAQIAALTRFWQAEPDLNTQYQRRRTAQLGLDTTWEAFQAMGWTESQLARLQSIWESCDFTDGLLDSLAGDRALRLSWFEAVRHSQKRSWEIYKGEISGIDDEYSLDQFWLDARETPRLLLWRLAWLDRDELEFLREWQAFLDQARVAVTQGDRRQFRFADMDSPQRCYRYCWWPYLLSRQQEPSPSLMVLQPLRLETQRRMTVVATALKRYELRNGRLPDGLSELVPTFLPSVPKDLMDGQPLRYRRSADGKFTLYSVGENGVDDGGSTERDREHMAGSIMWTSCDAVWFLPASEEDVAAWKRRAPPQDTGGRRGRLTADH